MIDKLKRFLNFSSPMNSSQQFATRQYQTNYFALISELPDPDPVLQSIGKSSSVYRDLLIDPHLSAVIKKRKSGVLSMKWQIDKKDASTRQHKFFQDYFNKSENIKIYNTINMILESIYFGYQPFAVWWQYQGGLMVPKIEDRPQEYFFYDKENQLRIRQRGSLEGIIPDPYSFIVARNEPSYINPYGDKIASKVFWPATFKKGGFKFWLTMSEKFGTPFIIGKQPRGTKKEDAEKLAEILDEMIQDAVAVINSDEEIDIKSDPFRTSSSNLYSDLVAYCNSEISKAVLTVANTTELGDVGSYAATQTQLEGEEEVNLSDVNIVEEVFNTLINWANQINFGNSPAPVFRLFWEGEVKKPLSERDGNLTNQGVKFTAEYYAEKYNLIPGKHFTLGHNEPQTDSFSEPVSPVSPVSPEFAEGSPVSPVVTSLSNTLQLQMTQTLKPVMDLINSTDDYQEIITKLADLYPEMKTTQLESLLEKTIFYSELIGRFDAAKN